MTTLDKFIRLFELDQRRSIAERAGGFIWYHCRATDDKSLDLPMIQQYFIASCTEPPSIESLRTAIMEGGNGIVPAGYEDTFRLKLNSEPWFDEKFKGKVFESGLQRFYIQYDRSMKIYKHLTEPKASKQPATQSEALLPILRVKALESQLLEQLSREINGCYEAGYYNACGVLCRRLVETLLIMAFVNKSHRDEILDGSNHYMTLEKLISKAISNQFIHIQRKTAPTLELIKNAGDRGAHGLYSNVTRQQIEAFSNDLSHVIDELRIQAGLELKE